MSSEDTQTIVINRQFGGFGLSREALDRLVEEHGYEMTVYDDDGGLVNEDAEIINDEGHTAWHYKLLNTRDAKVRARPELAKVVQELGEDANGDHASLVVVELPANIDWIVTEYDGVETVREKHRTWPGGDHAEGIMSSDDIKGIGEDE